MQIKTNRKNFAKGGERLNKGECGGDLFYVLFEILSYRKKDIQIYKQTSRLIEGEME